MQRVDLSRLSLGRLLNKRARKLRDDAGSTMVTVLIVMLVLTVGGISIAGVALRTAGMVSDSRDRTGAQSVVDGAIAALTVELMDGTLACDTGAPSSGTRTNGASADSPAYNWKLVCAVSGTTGTATLSAASNVGGEKAVREAVFNYQVTPSGTVSYGTPSSPIMLFGEDGTTFNSNNLVATNGNINVSIPRGSFTCNTPFPGDLVVHGTIKVQAGCKVSGNVISVTGGIEGPTFIVGGDMLAYGDISLNTNSVISGSMYSIAGKISLGGSTVKGVAQAGSDITLNGSQIDGNTSSGGKLTMEYNSKIAGNALVVGDIKLSSKAEIGGNAMSTNGIFTSSYGAESKVVGNLSTGGTGTTKIDGVVNGSVQANGPIEFNNFTRTVNGSVTAKGNISLECTTVKGAVTVPAGSTVTKQSWCASGYASLAQPATVDPPTFPALPGMPSTPVLPGWYEYQFQQSDWPGYTVLTLKNTGDSGSADPLTCGHYNGNSGGVPNGWATVKNFSGNTIIDARACSKISTNMGLSPTVELSHDLVLLANSYDLTSGTFRASASATGAQKPGLWLLKSDELPSDGNPSCSPAGNTKLNGTRIEDSLRTMVYTPCTIEVNAGSSLRGQLYGGRWAGSGGAGITFDAANIGLPGMTGGSGTPGTGTGTGTPGTGGSPVSGSFTLVSSQDLPVA